MTDYHSLFLRTADSMCEIDAAGRILRINSACQQMLPDARPGQRLGSYFEQTCQLRLGETVKSLRDSHPTGDFEGRHAQHDRWSSWQVTRLSEQRYVAVGRDVTPRYRTEVALEEKSTFLESIIEAEPECVKLVSAAGTLLDMNQAGLDMVGAASRDEVVGKSIYDLIAEEDRERFIDFNRSVCGGEGGELRFDVMALDGTRRSMETVAVPLAKPGASDEIMHLAITRDMTQRRMLEEQLRQAQKIEAIGQLAGGVAHDFNNLLTAIICPAEVALMKLDPNHPATVELAEIKATGTRAARLTEKLLTFARRQVTKPQAISLAEVLAGLREMLDRLLGETIDLQFNIESKTGTILADRGHIEQVVLNLVVNARDAVECAGSIEISLKDKTVSVPTAARLGCAPGPTVVLNVADDGVGIPPEVLPRIFDPFFTTKAPERGTGLGLSTCYGIVRQLGGAIDVYSELDVGTAVSVYIPIQPGEPTPVDTECTPGPGRVASIVVAEDEPAVRKALVRMLETFGHSVLQAENGEIALDIIRSHRDVDLVISDLTMPVMGGRELVSRLARELPHIPVLLTTGYLQPTAGEEQSGLDHVAVLQKPFVSAELRDAMAQLLSNNAAGARVASARRSS